MNDTDLTLIEKILSGDKEATQILYRQNERLWFRICLRYGRNRGEAEDIMQEGLIMIFRDLYQFDPQKGKFQTWSGRILVNSALRYLKKHQWQNTFQDLELANKEIDLSENILGKITAKELTEAIQQLPTGYRVVFNMYVIEGYSHREIAEYLQVSVGTSKSQLAKAKKALRQKLEILF